MHKRAPPELFSKNFSQQTSPRLIGVQHSSIYIIVCINLVMPLSSSFSPAPFLRSCSLAVLSFLRFSLLRSSLCLFSFLVVLIFLLSCVFCFVPFFFGSLYQGLERLATLPKCSFFSVGCFLFLVIQLFASPLPLPVRGLPCCFFHLPSPLLVPCFSGFVTVSLLFVHYFLRFKFPFLNPSFFSFLFNVLLLF